MKKQDKIELIQSAIDTPQLCRPAHPEEADCSPQPKFAP